MGRKERPLFFTNEVRFEVLKNGRLFMPDQYLHSGDAFDLSFEAGYPDQRWLGENIVHFYRQQYFYEGKPDVLIVVNKTNKVIKYLIIYSTDKFLMFDLQPGSETQLFASPPRGDISSFSVLGEFAEGRSFKKGAGFRILKQLDGPFTYHIYITDDGSTIECPQLEKHKEVGALLMFSPEKLGQHALAFF